MQSKNKSALDVNAQLFDTRTMFDTRTKYMNPVRAIKQYEE